MQQRMEYKAGVIPKGFRRMAAREKLPLEYWFPVGAVQQWFPGSMPGSSAVGDEIVRIQAPKLRKRLMIQGTSLEALESQKDKAPNDCAKILEELTKKPGGLTCDERPRGAEQRIQCQALAMVLLDEGDHHVDAGIAPAAGDD